MKKARCIRPNLLNFFNLLVKNSRPPESYLPLLFLADSNQNLKKFRQVRLKDFVLATKAAATFRW
jgi:hypothetical protein